MNTRTKTHAAATLAGLALSACLSASAANSIIKGVFVDATTGDTLLRFVYAKTDDDTRGATLGGFVRRAGLTLLMQ